MFNFSRSKKLLVLVIILSLASCRKYCMDIEFIEAQSLEFNTWFQDINITQKQVSSSVGITDEALLRNEFRDSGDSTWDDCGGVTQWLWTTSNYSFNKFPYRIEIRFDNFGEEDGFVFYTSYSRSGDFRNQYESAYRFVSQKTLPKNPTQLIVNFEHLGVLYSEALEVEFQQTSQPTEIKLMYVVKELGIVKLVLNNDIQIDFVGL